MADFKEFNEKIKSFEILATLESELMQKLSQADSDRDIDAKERWSNELHEVLKTRQALRTKRVDWITDLQK